MAHASEQTATRVGLEISSTTLNAVILDETDAVAKSISIALDQAAEFPAQVAALVSQIDREFGKFPVIGVAIPGLVDRKTGRVTFSAIVPRQSDVALGEIIRSATGRDVVIENDANAAAYGEFRLGAGRDAENMFYATLGEGVGGAFIFGGEIWHGASGFAGEFGYVPINSEGMRLEEVASAANIIRRTRSRVNQDGTSSLGGVNEEDLTLSDILAAARSEDDFAKMMLERTGIYVGTAVASVINVLNIERIVIGGTIMDAGELVLHAIVQRARELSFAPSFVSTTILAGELGSNAAAVGAALISGNGC